MLKKVLESIHLKKAPVILLAIFAAVTLFFVSDFASAQNSDRKPKDQNECRAWGGEVKNRGYSTSGGFNWECVNYTAPHDPERDGDVPEDVKKGAEDIGSGNVYIDRNIPYEECIRKGRPIFDETSEATGRKLYQYCEVGRETSANTFEEDKKKENKDEERPTCVVAGYGWLLCPVLNFFSKLADSLYTTIRPLLVVESLTNSGAYSVIRDIWAIFRNVANVGFVIIFMIVILSQTSSIGISNYEIKKMLPRLIVIAIITNLSLPLATLAVDISNIIGSSAKDLIESTVVDESYKNSRFEEVTSNILAGTAVTTIGATTIIGVGGLWISGAGYGLLILLAPVVISAASAMFITLLILTARQALILILICIMPVAIVLQLFKGTASYWNKWSKYFLNMLLIYPIISIVFGVSTLSAYVITMSHKDSALISLMAIGVQAIPLLAMPVLLRAVGRLGGAIGLASKASRFIGGKVGDRVMGGLERQRNLATAAKISKMTEAAKKRAAKGKKYSRRIRDGIIGGSIYRESQRQEAIKSAEESMRMTQQESHANRMINDEKYRQKMLGNLGDEETQRYFEILSQAKAFSQIEKMNQQLIKAHSASLSSVPVAELQKIIDDKNRHATEKIAALGQMIKRIDVVKVDDIISSTQILIYRNTAENYSPVIGQGVSAMLQEQMPGLVSEEAAQSVLQPPPSGSLGLDIKKEMQRALEADEVSPDDIKKLNPEMLEYAIKNATPEGREKLRDVAKIAIEEEKIQPKLENFGYVSEFARETEAVKGGRYEKWKAAKDALNPRGDQRREKDGSDKDDTSSASDSHNHQDSSNNKESNRGKGNRHNSSDDTKGSRDNHNNDHKPKHNSRNDKHHDGYNDNTEENTNLPWNKPPDNFPW